MRASALILSVVVALGVAACGGSSPRRSTRPSARGCAPRNIPAGRSLASGRTLVIRSGVVVYVALVEPEKYASEPYPQSFPWLEPSSSNSRVLTSIPLCGHINVSSLPLTVTAFRAGRPGSATLLAPLAPAWRSKHAGFAAFRASVTVRPG
jgi:hypothetical protein